MIHRGLIFLWVACLAIVTSVPVLWAQETAPDAAPDPAEAVTEAIGQGASPAASLAARVDMPPGAPDYDAWAKVATRAEEALQAGRASDAALSTLRAEVSGWRAKFAAARGENAVRITTLKTQIAALGPAPQDGASETETRAAQRRALNEQLALIETPVVVADIAHARADAIISEIDALLRARTADTLLESGPTPLNPALWPEAISDLTTTFRLAGIEAVAAIQSDTTRAKMRQSLAVLVIFVFIGIVLIGRGRRWVMQAGGKVQTLSNGPARGVWGFLISIGQMVAPFLGILFVFIVLANTNLLDGRPGYVSFLIFQPLLGMIVARWIGVRVFGQPGSDWAVLNLGDAARSEGRFEAATLGLAYGLWRWVEAIVEKERFSDATHAILSAPVMLLGAVLMFRLGRLFRSHAAQTHEDAAEGEGVGFRDRMLGLAGRAMILVSVAAPLILATGYLQLAHFMLWSTALSLALVGVLLALHRFFIDLYGALFRRTVDEAEQALVPVLASLLMLVASAPVFALIWGARRAELGELLAGLSEGVALGEAVITPSEVVVLVVVFAIGFGITRLIQGMLKATVLPKTRIDVGGRNAITSGVGYFGYFLAAVIAITAAGINLSSLAIVAGALSVGVGFGLQAIVSNFVSGIILLIERPISEGDWISVGPHMGIVQDISVRATRIETFDRQDVVIPNSDFISGTVTNYTRGNKVGRLVINVGVAYGTDTRRVSEILEEIVMEHPLVTVNPAPQVGFMAFGGDSLEFQIRAVLSDVSMILIVQDELHHRIAERFAQEGIEIPFAQRDIWLRNPEALSGKTTPPDHMQVVEKPRPDAPAGLDPDIESDGDGD